MPETAKRPPRPQPDDVRRAILDATLQIYLEKGYAGTGTDEIAARASVSKQTIYRHFADKDDLVRAAVLRLIADAEAQGAESFDALEASDDLEADLRRFARQHLVDVIQPDIMRLRRRIIAEVERFPRCRESLVRGRAAAGAGKACGCLRPPAGARTAADGGSAARGRAVQLADPVGPDEPGDVRSRHGWR